MMTMMKIMNVKSDEQMSKTKKLERIGKTQDILPMRTRILQST